LTCSAVLPADEIYDCAVGIYGFNQVEEAGPPHQAVDFVPLGEQELGKVGAVLPGNAGDSVPALPHMQPIAFQ
jgi:hypothetical protein